jgi:hypothetical protein
MSNQINADVVNERHVTNEQIDENAHAADYLGQDVDEYTQTAPAQTGDVESYLELSVDQTPSEALYGQTQADANYNAAISAENAGALVAEMNEQADAVIAQINAQVHPQLPPQPEDEIRNEALRGVVLYQSGAFANGAIGGLDRTPASSAQNAAIREGIYPLEDPVVDPVDDVDSIGPVERDPGSKKMSEEAVDSFTEHLHHPPPK